MKLGTGCFKRLVPFAAKVVSCCASYLRMKAQAARGGEELQDVVLAASAVISVSDLESIPISDESRECVSKGGLHTPSLSSIFPKSP